MIAVPAAAVFDLDDTLADTTATVLRPALREALGAMIAAGLPSSLTRLTAEADSLRHSLGGEHLFRRLAERFTAPDPDACVDAALDLFYRTPRDGILPRPGAYELLEKLAALGVRTFLMTFGEPEVQQRKVRDLGLDNAFESITLVDLSQGPDKTVALATLIEANSLPAKATWVVGDRPDGEIAAGKRLGCVTIRVRYGEFAKVEPQSPEERADLEVTGLRQLSRLL